jgi:hypothetical protein
MRNDDSIDAVNAPDFRIAVGDEKSFSMDRICAIKHNYHEHPLMRLDRLAQLAKSLMPMGKCRFMARDTTQSSKFLHSDKNPEGLEIEEVFRRIEEPGSWIALYNVEIDPEYDLLLRQALGTVRHLIDPQEPGIYNLNGFMFISAPPSATPFHIDRENNFWLQIRGRKTINVWDAADREAVAAKDVEEFIVGKTLRGVRLRDELMPRSHEFDTGPGDGVYFPSTSPHTTRSNTHWVRPGDGVSISIGMVFYTSVTQHRANVHAFNRALRRFGMNPRLPGALPWLDNLKYPMGRAVVSLMRRLRNYTPPPGF